MLSHTSNEITSNRTLYFVQKFTQAKAIDWQALVGNIGGYVGMILGWALINILQTIKKIFERFSERDANPNCTAVRKVLNVQNKHEVVEHYKHNEINLLIAF